MNYNIPDMLGEFKNVKITLNGEKVIGDMLRTFIKRGSKVMWRHRSERRVDLEIAYDRAIYMIPFIRNNKNTLLMDLNSVPIYHEDILDSFLDCIELLDGKGIYYSYKEDRICETIYNNGRVTNYVEMDYLRKKFKNTIYKEEIDEREEERKHNVRLEVDTLLDELSDLLNSKRYKGRAEDIKNKKNELSLLKDMIV